MHKPRQAVTVIGSGRMGRGIALSFAYQGYEAILVDVKERNEDEFNDLLSRSQADLESQMNVLIKANLVTEQLANDILKQIKIVHITDDQALWQNHKIVFEAVPEILEVKEHALQRVCSVIPEDALILSTTSSFSANDIARFVTNKERFLNTHWLNPAYLLPLIEVSASDHTSEKSIQRTMQLLESIGKVPVRCKSSPGFIVPRIQALAMNEAARMVEEEVATPEELDKAIRTGFAPRFVILGLLEFIDWGGLDTLYYASNYLASNLEDNRHAPPSIINNMMEKGEIGLKSKKGFYEFDEQTLDDYQLQTLAKFIDLLQHLGYISPPNIQKQ